MPDWVINAAVMVAGIGISYGALRATVADLVKRLDAIQSTADRTAERLVKLETRLEALDSLRFDDRLRAMELQLAGLQAHHGQRGTS